jgi:hypothetical protein
MIELTAPRPASAPEISMATMIMRLIDTPA